MEYGVLIWWIVLSVVMFEHFGLIVHSLMVEKPQAGVSSRGFSKPAVIIDLYAGQISTPATFHAVSINSDSFDSDGSRFFLVRGFDNQYFGTRDRKFHPDFFRTVAVRLPVADVVQSALFTLALVYIPAFEASNPYVIYRTKSS